MAGRLKQQRLPKLFPRGLKGIYQFRIHEGGRDSWVSTKRSTLEEAEDFRRKYFDAENVGRAEAKQNRTATQIADKVAHSITGKDVQRTPIKDLFPRWRATDTSYDELTPGLRSHYLRITTEFVDWCRRHGIECVENVTPEDAKKYAKILWDSHLTPKTFNTHVTFLSRVFSSLDTVLSLPSRNPFDRRVVARKSIRKNEVARHEGVEPTEVEKLVVAAAKVSAECRDLFILGHCTGLRLKDACLLKWSSVLDTFIEVKPAKTQHSDNTARIPICGKLKQMLTERRHLAAGEYLFPEVAADYKRDPSGVSGRAKRIFEDVFPEAETVRAPGNHRFRKSSILSFHSFRVTMMSLLASKNVPLRDAMRMMGWESLQMVLDYERLLNRSREEADKRATALIHSLEELQGAIPPLDLPLRPSEKALRYLLDKYSNIAIGVVYGISEAAVRKHLRKYRIVRDKRVMSAALKPADIEEVRQQLRQLEVPRAVEKH